MRLTCCRPMTPPSGFDNIGDMLTVSPVLLERYFSAANKVSRLAAGDTNPSLGSGFYPVSQFYLQDDRMSDDLPLGSRGGAVVRHYFPADGEYVFTLQFGGAPAAGCERAHSPISRSRAHTHWRHGHPLQTVPSAGLIERP